MSIMEPRKPIPSSALHHLSDYTLHGSIQIFRDLVRDGVFTQEIADRVVNEIFMVMGYRCALDYYNQYGKDGD